MKTRRTKWYMDTFVDIQAVPGRGVTEEAAAGIERAFGAFRKVEQACSRFSPDSELMTICRLTPAGTPVSVSPLLYEPLQFALELAEWTGGRFDPSLGGRMEGLGFNRHYLTGETMRSAVSGSATYRDIVLNGEDRSVTLLQPLVLDLGAVAKGFAIDLAARELAGLQGFRINAGGDLYAGGVNEQGRPWEIGIRHPFKQESTIWEMTLSDQAVCTSGGYERPSPLQPGTHHLIDPPTGRSPGEWASCSIIAPYAMMADALATAVFVMGREGLGLVEEAEAAAVLVTSDGSIVQAGRGLS
ncbi:FAD:protein FMN transferase [Paenibacillus aurantius]|uniref:FAD:protein FMN transferase n=1 Tax=Paenibacillus aurantius TaxID=2918900 RepID=A0AA96LIP3_9BACL|nr:FAD:protein FMN transferase [Paenibacillus aurantius]WNQ12830.1 FAD:protein FMN transferase [Paenibacillus aurantius]